MKLVLKTAFAIALITRSFIDSLFATAIVYNLGDDGPFPFDLVRGFSYGERTHRWTDGNLAEIQFSTPSPEYGPLQRIQFVDTQGFIFKCRPQQIDVDLNDVRYATYYYNPLNPIHTINIEIPTFATQAHVKFNIPTAISPAVMGQFNDSRNLGIMINQIVLVYPATSSGNDISTQ